MRTPMYTNRPKMNTPTYLVNQYQFIDK